MNPIDDAIMSVVMHLSKIKIAWNFDNRSNNADVGSNCSVDVTYKFHALGRRVFRDHGTTALVYVQAGQQTIADNTESSAPSSPTYCYVCASYIDEPASRFKPSRSELHYSATSWLGDWEPVIRETLIFLLKHRFQFDYCCCTSQCEG